MKIIFHFAFVIFVSFANNIALSKFSAPFPLKCGKYHVLEEVYLKRLKGNHLLIILEKNSRSKTTLVLKDSKNDIDKVVPKDLKFAVGVMEFKFVINKKNHPYKFKGHFHKAKFWRAGLEKEKINTFVKRTKKLSCKGNRK